MFKEKQTWKYFLVFKKRNDSVSSNKHVCNSKRVLFDFLQRNLLFFLAFFNVRRSRVHVETRGEAFMGRCFVILLLHGYQQSQMQQLQRHQQHHR